MVDHLIICVDRLIASACFESVNGGPRDETSTTVDSNNDSSVVKINNGVGGEEEGCCSSSKKGGGEVRECRICQEEDEEFKMEAPCACNGTLKFAHRKCIQRWCNKKGDITCEICNQVYSPNYILPPARTNPDVLAISLRQWAPQIDLRDPHFLALAAERHLMQSEYDEYAVANTGGLACFRAIALILMVILLIRQALMVTKEAGLVQDSSTFFNVSVLQFAGFLLPCYVMARTWYIIQSRRRRQ
ncbi:Protein of unknown function DUF3675, partial [Dillenia turbinata]